MNLYKWAADWGVPNQAILDLRQRLGVDPFPVRTLESDIKTETGLSKALRLKASREGKVLWRNNVGVAGPVRFGLANDSQQMNKQIKSSDLIGIGEKGVFTAREVKKPDWKFSGDEREQAQLKFLLLCATYGADVKFATSLEDV